MLILMPEGDFHLQLPEGEVHESSELGQTLILSFFVPEFFPLFLAEHGVGWSLEREMKQGSEGCCKSGML